MVENGDPTDDDEMMEVELLDAIVKFTDEDEEVDRAWPAELEEDGSVLALDDAILVEPNSELDASAPALSKPVTLEVARVDGDECAVDVDELWPDEEFSTRPEDDVSAVDESGV